VATRDAGLVELAETLLQAAHAQWPDRMITEPNAKGPDPAELYTETHYALAAVLLALLSGRERHLDLAQSRLRLWDDAGGPMTFFNAMAVCLAAVVARQAGVTHAGLTAILARLLSRAREHRAVAWTQNCGNNAYLQQVAVDTVLLPLARGEAVTQAGRDVLLAEFRRYRTPEGFFVDLPRWGTRQEPLSPPTYVMKMLFLAGICHVLHSDEELAELCAAGMRSTVPLLSRNGQFSYFGRTDNSPFAAGLTIFNLRKAAHLLPDLAPACHEACIAGERFYASFPRTDVGLLRSNRFADPDSLAELNRSRDVYSYDGQYSLSSCAYVLLASHWFPAADGGRLPALPARAVGHSDDLGVARLEAGGAEAIVRTTGEVTGWDRRYLAPTILRLQIGDRLAVGAIPKSVETDASAGPPAPSGRLRRVYGILRDRYLRGFEQLDAVGVGFLPVLRCGAVDYLPHAIAERTAASASISIRYRMLGVHVRGVRPCVSELGQAVGHRLKLLGQDPFRRPVMRPDDSVELRRTVRLEPTRCRIEDSLSGDLAGRTLVFSVRHMPGAIVHVHGLRRRAAVTAWSSDGRQTIEVFEGTSAGPDMRYACDIELLDDSASVDAVEH